MGRKGSENKIRLPKPERNSPADCWAIILAITKNQVLQNKQVFTRPFSPWELVEAHRDPLETEG